MSVLAAATAAVVVVVVAATVALAVSGTTGRSSEVGVVAGLLVFDLREEFILIRDFI
jgi:hypothetical protein